MELATKQGFKQTEVGLIPEDWRYSNFGELISNLCYGPRFSSKDYSKTGNVKTIRGTDINLLGDILYEQVPVAQLPKALVKEHMLVDGDLVMITTADCGLTGVYFDDGFPYISSAYAVRITLNSQASPLFFKYLFQTKLAKEQIELYIRKGTVGNLPSSDIYKFKFPLPPTLKEQKAIATALSDVDDLIVSLEGLIAKKQAIKQGAMQQLLTPPHKGGKRLPGFSGDWVEKTIEELSKTFTKQTGFDYSNHIKPILLDKVQRNTYPFIQNKDFDGYNINFDTDYYIPCEVAEKFPRILLNEKCLLISISGSIGKVGVFNNKQTAFIGGAVAVGKFLEKDLLDWVMLYLKSEAGQNLMLKDVKAGSHQNLILDDIRKMKIPIPPKNEQIEVCGILKDIQKDIEQLETKKAKYQQLKQGMLQELLTGNTRLV
ncbi:restriction endonuclease subunit S [Tenacibaculum maritimum]|uniref:restriction endonuclease subunit S n=1 Tax=Tenacibaculum maritimum TaxID=107401 RepID=UPI00387647A3